MNFRGVCYTLTVWLSYWATNILASEVSIMFLIPMIPLSLALTTGWFMEFRDGEFK